MSSEIRAIHLPPIPAPTRPNLLTSVSLDDRGTIGRWQTGISYQPPRYNGSSTFDPAGLTGSGTKTVTDSPDDVSWDPVVLWAADTCSTLGDFEEVEARARGELESQTSHQLEEVLWTNTVDGSDFGADHPNVGLADASLVENSNPVVGQIYTPNAYNAYPIVTAFRDMNQALTTMLGGARGMIHVEHRLLPDLAYAGLAVMSGQRLVSTLGDHIVVPGTGYDGSGPNGEASSPFHSWIYGTTTVEVLLGPIEVFGDRSQLVNKSTNKIEIRAERIALAHWDRQAHIAIPVCLEDPFGDCSDAGS